MNRKQSLRLLAFVLMISFSIHMSSAAAEAGLSAADQEAAPRVEEPVSSAEESGYDGYAAEQEGWPAAADDLVVDGEPHACGSGDTMEFAFSVPQNGLYEFLLEYACTGTQDLVLSLEVDGRLPFDEAERLTFPAHWVDAEQRHIDGLGNEFAPDQMVYEGRVQAKACDNSGRHELPYRFALSAGEHTLRLTVQQGAGTVHRVVLAAPEQTESYQAPEEQDGISDIIILEGEDGWLKNSRSLIPLSDGSSPAVHPSDPLINKLNYIGGSNWGAPGSAITWKFHVETSGYYSIGFQYRQNQLIGGVSYRHLLIDGKTPVEEARRLKFTYDSSWQYETFSQDGEPCWLYLEEGDHTLTLTATGGALSEIYAAMQDITSFMGNMYVDITKIVGETVDIYRSYELFNQIPHFNEDLDQLIADLESVAARMEALQEQDGGSSVSIVRNAIRVVRQMRDNPYTAHRYKSQFYDCYTNLSALMSDMVNMPLDIDYIRLAGSGAPLLPEQPSLLERFGFSCRRFFYSFVNDYSAVSTSGGQEESLTIWVNWGRDQAQVLNNIIQDDFVRESGIGVNLSVVNATLIQALLSGKGPDCMIQMPRTEPVNLAMRGALVDLSQFPDFEDVLKRFTEDASVPYQYGGGTYALPDTQSFFMMFLRTDILQSMGIERPDTWTELVDASTILQRNNLEVSLPYTQITDSGTVNTGVGGLNLYATLLIQNGLPLYTADGSACTMAEPEQMQVFLSWVDWYTKYKIPVVTDFFNRFRIGSAPIGIAPYTMYTQLNAAAPEIEGRWTVAPLPGVEQEDGTINRSSAGSGTGCSITKLSEKPENAWTFLKWWTSADTQLKYSLNLESALGALGRRATANLEALSQMDWDTAMREQLEAQQALTVEIPEVPGGYYTARGVDQVFWGAVEQGENTTELLLEWGAVVNREIARKRAEYVTD